ncbi:hypothetical protein CRENBAI_005537 [Crenichthys baileyi]|uniref:Secreted protein n=1 Tax=Crenichthys baileyi TaxID=28760 RepID=A0AAV9QU48_9TELE
MPCLSRLPVTVLFLPLPLISQMVKGALPVIAPGFLHPLFLGTGSSSGTSTGNTGILSIGWGRSRCCWRLTWLRSSLGATHHTAGTQRPEHMIRTTGHTRIAGGAGSFARLTT